MRRSHLLLAALLLLPAPLAAQRGAAVLRPHVLVQGSSVLLSDLFVGAPGIVAFPAPAPGRRLVLEPGQIAQLARAHGIGWRPLPGAERIVIERPGQLLSRASAEAALRSALAPLGAGPDDGFDFGAPLPLVPAAMEPAVSAEDAVLDTATGRFAATLVLDHGEGEPQRVRMVGRAWAGVAAVVPVRRMAAGQVLRAGDLRIEHVRADRAGQLADPAAAVGLTLRRPVAAGQPLAATDLTRPAVVSRNSAVMMLITAPGMSVGAQGRALEDGAMGEVIRVQNVASRAVVAGEVTGPGRVRVALGSLPLERPGPGQNPSPVRR
ncbi:MAG: flagellar basal body P-ring formation protein FlgA [Acetobacteraceae bacterium]|nr:flagellar basal body P-ring formation protein FlgA [Acetobacteraceae bacterium]